MLNHLIHTLFSTEDGQHLLTILLAVFAGAAKHTSHLRRVDHRIRAELMELRRGQTEIKLRLCKLEGTDFPGGMK